MKSVKLICVTAMAIFAFLAMPVLLQAQEQVAKATFFGNNGRVAWKGFLSADFTTSAIFSAKPDGGDVQQLTFPDPGVGDDLPDWSPDGSTIVFDRNFPNIGQIYRVNADGTGVIQIGDCTGECLGNDGPTYSPDGEKIAFVKFIGPVRPDGTATDVGVWIMNADGTDPVQITQQQVPTISEDHQPTWSPNGMQLVFTRINLTAKPAGQQALFIISRDGSDPHRITPWWLNGGGADWSPNGRSIVFQSFRDCCPNHVSQIYSVRPDGSKLKKLTTGDKNGGRNIEPDWSPDGKKIVFAHQPGTGANGFADIYEMRANGSGIVPLIRTDLWESEPDWGTHE